MIPSMRRLYFDVDGTVLRLYTNSAKTALAEGALGRAIRDAGFEEIVCVGKYVEIVRAMTALVEGFDALGAILDVCAGVFADEEWFRAHARLVENPDQRAAEVDLASDWWYVDDLAEKYFMSAGRAEIYREHLGSRIFSPSPEGEGQDVLDWLDKLKRP